MSATARHDGDPGEVERLRALVHDLGEAVTTLTNSHDSLMRMLSIRGRSATERTVSPYEEAAAIQARRRAIHLVRANGGSL